MAETNCQPQPGKAMPLPQVIRCLEERLAAAHQGISSIGSLAELVEQALPYLKQFQRFEELH